MTENNIQVVVTGLAWMGGGVGSIESALEKLFREANQEIAFTAYSATGGADLLFDWTETALARGVRILAIINHLMEQPEDIVVRLQRLNTLYQHFLLYDFLADSQADMHAKVVVADRWRALVGSSNLSRRGLHFNHELAVLLQGPAAVTIATALDRLCKSAHVRRVSCR